MNAHRNQSIRPAMRRGDKIVTVAMLATLLLAALAVWAEPARAVRLKDIASISRSPLSARRVETRPPARPGVSAASSRARKAAAPDGRDRRKA